MDRDWKILEYSFKFAVNSLEGTKQLQAEIMKKSLIFLFYVNKMKLFKKEKNFKCKKKEDFLNGSKDLTKILRYQQSLRKV